MNEQKFKHLLAIAGAEKPPVPAATFASDMMRLVRGMPRLPKPLTFSLFDQLNRLFPRIATAAAAIILLCFAGDFVCTLTGLPDVGEATAQLATDNLFDVEDL